MIQPLLLSESGHNLRTDESKYFSRFGYLHGMDLETRQIVRRRVNNHKFITNGYELGRLRVKLDQLNKQISNSVNGERARLIVMKADCEKAIATLALAVPEGLP